MHKDVWFSLLFFIALSFQSCLGQETARKENYTYKNGSRDGIGKWHMNREIAHVMGFQGMRWLERPEREKEENTTRLLENMNIKPNDAIADIGAGSGYHAFKMAKIASEGHVYAVDIQDKMLEAIRRKKAVDTISNISTITGTETNVNLFENSIDKVLLVDVYHEFNEPIKVIASIKKTMRPNGKLYLIEYRGEDANVPIKILHKMTEKQAVKEMKAAGLKLEQNIGNLPWQHCMVFVKE